MGLGDAARRPQPVEQRQLRVPVRLPRPVQLEVLVGHVGHDRDVVGDARNAVEGQAVRRGLDHRDPVAGVGHRPQRGLQRRRLGGRGVLRVVLGAAADTGRDRADHPGGEPGGLERGDREVGGRGLAVGSGDPDHRELVGWVAVPPRGCAGQGRACRIDDQLRRRDPGQRPFDDDARGARVERRRHEVVAVRPLAGDRHEQHPGPHGARVVGDAGHVDARQLCRGDRPAVAPRAAQPALARQTTGEVLERATIRLAHRWTSRSARDVSRPIA